MGNASKIMGKVAGLTNINEIASIATNMQNNLTKLGVVAEMVDDAMEDMDQDTVGDDMVCQVSNCRLWTNFLMKSKIN